MKKPIFKTIKVTAIVIAFICCIIYIASFNQTIRSLAYTGYYWLFKFDHFNTGSKMYASNNFINDNKSNGLVLYRIMRPLTSEELRSMDTFEKSKLNIDEDHINAEAKPLAVSCNKWLTKSGMKLQHSSYVGTYLDSKYLAINGTDKDHNPVILHMLFYAINPNQHVFVDNGRIYKNELPVNYTWADSTLYLPAMFVAKKDHENVIQYF